MADAKRKKMEEFEKKLCKEKQRIHFENDIYENAIERMLKQLRVCADRARPRFSYARCWITKVLHFYLLFLLGAGECERAKGGE